MNQTKPFSIPKEVVWNAYKRVKKNKGAHGVDEVSLQDFERNLEDNLYKLWNRMSSGSYFPPAVRTVEIPKRTGGARSLGIPTVGDRIAQEIVKRTLEPKVEPLFHPDSYGYRPKKSASKALGVARERCWRYNWVLDIDIKGFFDNLDHTLLMKAVCKHTDSKWTLLYIERWLKAPAQLKDGTLLSRDKGTPQGGVISPLLANLFLHYAFDSWIRKNYPSNCFERYADDILVHCEDEEEAAKLRMAIEERLLQCKLELNLEKTKIVYCKDSRRRRNHPHIKFDFLGYTFRPRSSKDRSGRMRTNFAPAVSNEAAKRMSHLMRRWRLHLRSDKSLNDLARMINPIIRGWIHYYGKHYKDQLYPVFSRLNLTLVRWAMRKYKRLASHLPRAWQWLGRIVQQNPNLFAHWQMSIAKPAVGR